MVSKVNVDQRVSEDHLETVDRQVHLVQRDKEDKEALQERPDH